MPNLKNIKNSVKTLKNVSKVTKTMQQVSFVKLKHTQNQAFASRPYHENLISMIRSVYNSVDEKSVYIRKPKTTKTKKNNIQKKIALVVVGFGKGFVGALTSKMIAKVKEFAAKNAESKITGISIHKLGLKILDSAGIGSKYHFAHFYDKPDHTTLFPIYLLILDGFISGVESPRKDGRKSLIKEIFDEVYILYVYYDTSFNQISVLEKILPVEVEETPIIRQESGKYTYEPTRKEVLDALFKEYAENKILFAILNNNASENAARMNAMKKATDNTKELVSNLTHSYNKLRQAQVTQQAIEGVSEGSI